MAAQPKPPPNNTVWRAITSLMAGLIAILVTVFIFILDNSAKSLEFESSKRREEIVENKEEIKINRNKTQDLQITIEKIRTTQHVIVEDVGEIKSDVKKLLGRP